MATSTALPDISNACRLCLTNDQNIRQIFSHENTSFLDWSEQNISELIYECTGIQVLSSDEVNGICKSCLSEITAFIKFRRKCQQINEFLRQNYTHQYFNPLARAAEEFNSRYAKIAFIDLGTESSICHLETKEVAAEILNDNFSDESGSDASETSIDLNEENNEMSQNKGIRYKLKNRLSHKSDDFNFIKLSKRDLNIPKAYYGLCEICGRGFKHLWRHLMSHSEEPVDTCDICGKGFKSKSGLQLHILVHKEAHLPCEVCGKKYRTNVRLNRHMRVHTNYRPFPCKMCDKKFYTKYNLDVHNRIHTGEKPFSCKQCKEQFTHSYALKHHLEKNHPS